MVGDGRSERLAGRHGPPSVPADITDRAREWTAAALAQGTPVTPLTLAEGAHLTCGGAARLLAGWAGQGRLTARPAAGRNAPYAVAYALPDAPAPTRSTMPAPAHPAPSRRPPEDRNGALRADPAAPAARTGAVADPRVVPALDYAAAGWAVFVLGRTKRPVANCRACSTAVTGHDPQACGCLTCHGFYAATTDPDRVRAMLAAVPSGLLALRTGAVCDRVVLDIDPRHGGRLDPRLMLPTAVVASGGADGGWHLHYRHPGGYVPSRKLPGHPGVDVKGDGGYVVLPPSVHPATRRPYRWAGDRDVREMHPALVELVRATTAGPPPGPATLHHPYPDHRPPARTTAGGGCISSPGALLAAHLAAVAAAPEGRRRRTLYGAARGIARMVAADALTPREAWQELAAAGRAAGQTPAQTRNAIVGAFTAEGVPLTPGAA